eukprot:1989521-Amphidinium_carterae.1
MMQTCCVYACHHSNRDGGGCRQAALAALPASTLVVGGRSLLAASQSQSPVARWISSIEVQKDKLGGADMGR